MKSTGWPRRAAGASIALLCLLLVPLVAGAGLDAPPTPAEVARLERALAPEAAGARSLVADAYVLAAAGREPGPLPTAAAEITSLVTRARVFQLGVLFAIAGLTYVALLLARGRLVAALACAAFAVQPAVLSSGHVLRPEVVATAFALLAVVQLQCLAALSRAGRRGVGPLLAAQMLGVGGSAAVCIGLSLAAQPDQAALVLAPGLVMTAHGVQMAWLALRLVRRRGWLRLPIRAINRRLVPWTAMSLGLLGIAALVLGVGIRGAADQLGPTSTGCGLLAAAGPARWLGGIVLVGGAVLVLVRTGTRLGRSARVAPDFVLLAAAATVLVGGWAAPAEADGLRGAPYAAWLVAEAALAVLAVIGLRRRSAR